MKILKVIIAGSRTLEDYSKFCFIVGPEILQLYTSPSMSIEIVSGGARGIDTLAVKFAKQHLHPYKIMRADWDAFGKSAGYIRNKQMADYADVLIAVWDGKSKGTENMIEQMQKLNKKVIIKLWDKGE